MAGEGTYYGIGLDNASLKKSAQESVAEFKKIDKAADQTGQHIGKLQEAFQMGLNFDGGGLKELKESIRASKEYLAELKIQYKDTMQAIQKKGGAGANSALDAQLKQIKEDIDLEEAALKGLETRMQQMTAGSASSFRTEMMRISNTMRQMRLDGEEDTEMYRELEARMRQLVEVQKQFQVEQKNMAMGAGGMFSGMVNGIQGLMGAYSVASGIVGQFTTDQQKLMEVQTKMQSTMAVLIGLQQVANTLNSTSAFRVTVVSKAMQVWHAWNLKTGTSLIRLGVSATAARTATLALHGALLGLGGAAIIAAIAVISKIADESKRAREEQKKFAEEVSNSVSSQIAKYRQLQQEWADCNGDLELQKQVVEKNKDAWKELGFKVEDVTTYENVAVQNSEAVVNALVARAKAAAYASMAESKYAQAIQLRMQAETVGAKWWQKWAAATASSESPNGPSYDEIVASFAAGNKEKLLDQAQKLEGEAEDLIRKGLEENNIAADLLKDLPTHITNTNGKVADAYAEALEKVRSLTENFGKQITKEQRDGILQGLNVDMDTAKAEGNWADYFAKKRQYAAQQYEWERADALAAYEETEADVAAKRAEWQKKGWDTSALDANLEAARQLYDTTLSNIAAKESATAAEILADETAKNDEIAKSEQDLADEVAQHRIDYLIEYGTMKEKELAIEEKYDRLIAEASDDWTKKSLRKKKEQELRELKSTYGEIYRLVAKDVSKMGLFTINKAIADAEAEIARLSADPTMVEDNAQAIEYLRQAIERLKRASSDFSMKGILKMLLEANKDGAGAKSIAERFNAIKEAWNNMSSEQKWSQVGNWVSGIASGLSKAAEYMREVANIGGNTALADTADQLSAVAQNFAAAGGGAASGGWIGAIVGGVTDILGQTIEAFANVAKQEAIAAANARDYRMEVEKLAIAVNEADFSSVFGDMNITRGRSYAKNAQDTIALYQQKAEELAKKYGNQNYFKYKDTDVFTGYDLFLPIIGSIIYRASQMDVEANDWRAYQDAIDKGYEGIQRMLVKTKAQTGWAKFWGAQDEYTSLGDLAPEIWQNGELNVEAAKAFLATNTQITDEQRKQIENLVELKEGYDKAMQEIDGVISDTFGGLAESLSDVIWDSVVNGGDDAWAKFTEIGSDAISKLGKQLISEMLISEYLEQFRDRMRNAYKMNSMAETQAELRSIVGDIFGGMGAMLEAGTAVAEEYKKWAEEHGFDLSDTSGQQRQGVTKTALGASQESVDESNARLSTMQVHTFEMNETTKAIRNINTTIAGFVSGILGHVIGIHKDTTEIKESVAEVAADVKNIRTDTSSMQKNGVTIKR